MKITQTDTQMEIKTNGTLVLVMGVFLSIIGIVVLVTVLTGLWKVQGNGQSTSVIGPIVGAVMVLGGIITALLAKNEDSIFQKGGTSTITLKRILFGSPKVVSFDTKRIQSVCLITVYTSDTGNNSSGMKRSSQLSVMLDDNSLVRLAQSSFSSSASVNGINLGGLVTKAPLSKQAEQIAQFLGVPLKSSGDVPSIGNIIKGVTEAIHEKTEQGQIISEKTPVSSQPVAGTAPASQPVPPLEPTVPPQDNNWQS